MWAVRLHSVRPVGLTGRADQSDRPVGPTIVPCKRPVINTLLPDRSGPVCASSATVRRTLAILLRVRSFVWLNDALHMRTMTGARTSLARLTSQVGSGSSSHCFAADSFKMEATSLTVAGRQAESNS